jgi:hypothetical protein
MNTTVNLNQISLALWQSANKKDASEKPEGMNFVIEERTLTNNM